MDPDYPPHYRFRLSQSASKSDVQPAAADSPSRSWRPQSQWPHPHFLLRRWKQGQKMTLVQSADPPLEPLSAPAAE